MRSSNYLRQAKRRNHNKGESNRKSQWQDRVVGKYQLSLMLDINRAQLDSWIKEGMPVLQHGGLNKEWEFDLVEIRAWATANGYLKS
ncbi:terminase small subunit [Pleionea sediminis]|uniref:terminase small subunit n=1 Tax=Pleionea sediminis TaxID=2569479 RepID=UPI0011853D07|nr:terminase small subunit [Pleionea sediminis]